MYLFELPHYVAAGLAGVVSGVLFLIGLLGIAYVIIGCAERSLPTVSRGVLRLCGLAPWMGTLFTSDTELQYIAYHTGQVLVHMGLVGILLWVIRAVLNAGYTRRRSKYPQIEPFMQQYVAHANGKIGVGATRRAAKRDLNRQD